MKTLHLYCADGEALGLSPTLLSAYGFTAPSRTETPDALIEHLFRVRTDALLLLLPKEDADAAELLARIDSVAEDQPLRVFLLTDRPIPFPLVERVTDCFMLPCPAETLVKRMRLFCEVETPIPVTAKAADRICSETLLRLGVSPRLQGFEMLRLAAQHLLGASDPNGVRMMTEVYPIVAARTGTSVSIVEHGMRQAIETAWMRAELSELEAFAGYTTRESKPTPSNSAFLYLLVERIKLKLGGSGSTHAILREMSRFAE